MKITQDRDKLFNKCKNVIDKLVAIARNKNHKYCLIPLTTIADRLDLSKYTLYGFSFYDYFNREYLSVNYVKNKGAIKIDIPKWIRERKEERYRKHLNKQHNAAE